jgi:hypothetical protein
MSITTLLSPMVLHALDLATIRASTAGKSTLAIPAILEPAAEAMVHSQGGGGGGSH